MFRLTSEPQKEKLKQTKHKYVIIYAVSTPNFQLSFFIEFSFHFEIFYYCSFQIFGRNICHAIISNFVSIASIYNFI